MELLGYLVILIVNIWLYAGVIVSYKLYGKVLEAVVLSLLPIALTIFLIYESPFVLRM